MNEELAKGIAPDWSFLGLDDIPLHSEILPGLWLGGTADEDVIGVPLQQWQMQKPRTITNQDFDLVITLYAYAMPVDWLVEELRYGYFDAGIENIDFDALHRVADYTHASWKSGKRVLIRCQAGLNRSSLIMALLLIKEGYRPVDAITLMRNRRIGHVLFNREFKQYVLSLGGENSETNNEAPSAAYSIQ